MINKIFLLILVVLNCAANQDLIPLFKTYPNLKGKVPFISLGDFPSPIYKCRKLSRLFHHKIYFKRDDLTGKKDEAGYRNYSGNKLRKLQHVLAQAIDEKKDVVVTQGSAGSNHAVATSVCTKGLGLKCLLMLKPQPASNRVQHNLLMDTIFGSELRYFPDAQNRQVAIEELLKRNPNYYFIPTGASNALGCIGFVNAIFELKEQIDDYLVKEPDYIYVAVGSGGTTAGLLLGIQLLNLKTKVVAVTVEPEIVDDEILLLVKKLFHDTNQLLHFFDPNFPLVEFPDEKLIINKNFCGSIYGEATKEGLTAIKLVKLKEKIILDETYTGKAMAALINDLQNKRIDQDEIVLFWNTYCGLNFNDLIRKMDYRKLPVEFHQYFE